MIHQDIVHLKNCVLYIQQEIPGYKLMTYILQVQTFVQVRKHQDPVVSLTSSLRGQLVKCFMT